MTCARPPDAERIADGMSRENAVKLFTAVDVVLSARNPEEWEGLVACGKLPDLWFLDCLLARLVERFTAPTLH